MHSITTLSEENIQRNLLELETKMDFILYLEWALSIDALSILITATIISETFINVSATNSITSETISTAAEVRALKDEWKIYNIDFN